MNVTMLKIDENIVLSFIGLSNFEVNYMRFLLLFGYVWFLFKILLHYNNFKLFTLLWAKNNTTIYLCLPICVNDKYNLII